MPVPSDVVGTRTAEVIHPVDARWLMAYAASLGRDDAVYLDTRRTGGIVGHPVFPVCVEWPAVLAAGRLLADAGLSRAEAARSVHHTHELTVHRPIRPDDELRTTATVAEIEPRRAGARVLLELRTVDAAGAPVATTRMGNLYRGVEVAGAAAASPAADRPDRSGPPERSPARTRALAVPANAAHVYTECARIWNPIHTDTRTAAEAGLPGPILHGTATLAMAVGDLVATEGGGDPSRVTRVSARFAGMVPMPCRLELRVEAPIDPTVRFTVVGPHGETVLADGRLDLSGPAPSTAS